MVRSYFDESAEEKVGQGFLVVAGYVFDRRGLRGLEREWRRMLDRYKLPYFHMTECNVENPKPPNVFSHLDKPQRIKAATDAIALARRYPLHGEAYVVRQEEYREILEDQGFECDAYSFLLWSALLQSAKWCAANRPQQPLSLFFEQGYKTQRRANDLLQFVSQDDVIWRNKHRPSVIKHEFISKDQSCHGQTADLLAWHIRKGNANGFEGKPIRRDTLALIEDLSIRTVHYHKERLMEISEYFVRQAGSLQRASKILFTTDVLAAVGEA